jgi:homoserine acetyltransferase
MIRRIATVLVAIFFACAPVASRAQSRDVIVEKKTFELPSYTTVAGETIKPVKIGWEAAGNLNADKSNAILITHFFSGKRSRFSSIRNGIMATIMARSRQSKDLKPRSR